MYKSQPYVFNKVKNGINGSNGSDGKGIKSHAITYQVSTSGTVVPTGTWLTSIPSVNPSQYLWTRITITYTDNTTANAYSVGMMGATGDKGDTGSVGATGTGIESVTTEYYLSTSKTAQSGGSWQTTMPSWSYGKYLWIRSKVVYKNPSSTTYTVPYCDSSWEAVNNVENDILAWCYNNNKTYIDGGKIYSKTITTSQLSTDAIKSLNYVSGSTGSFLNLADGSFDSKFLKWTKEGVLTATSGSIAGIKIEASKLTTSSTSNGITKGYDITNDGYIRTYNKGSGRDYSLYLTAEKVVLSSQTSAGSVPKEMSLTDSSLNFVSEGTTVGYISASSNGLSLYGKSSINIKSNLTCTTTNISTTTFGALTITRSGSSNASVIKFVNSNGTLGYIGMTNIANGKLLRWTADSTTTYEIIDSWGGNITNNSDEALVVKGGIKTRILHFSNDVGSYIAPRTGGGFDFRMTGGGLRITFDGSSGKIYRVSADGVWTTLTN